MADETKLKAISSTQRSLFHLDDLLIQVLRAWVSSGCFSLED